MATPPPEMITITVGRTIQMIRKGRGLTQKDLARKIGVSYQQVQKYEHGVSRVSAAMLFKIAHCLDIPINRLFDDIGVYQQKD